MEMDDRLHFHLLHLLFQIPLVLFTLTSSCLTMARRWDITQQAVSDTIRDRHRWPLVRTAASSTAAQRTPSALCELG